MMVDAVLTKAVADELGKTSAIHDPSVLQSLKQMLDLFLTGLSLTLIIGFATLAVMQLLHPIVRGATQSFQLILLRRSINTNKKYMKIWENPGIIFDPEFLPEWLYMDIEIDWDIVTENLKINIQPVLPYPRLSNLLNSVSNGLLMKRVQDGADQLLARPTLNMIEFRWLTATASEWDANTIMFLDWLAQRDPGHVAALLNDDPDSKTASLPDKERRTGRAEAVAAAQQSVRTAAERRLDDLQLQLDGNLALITRFTAIYIGFVTAGLAARAVGASDLGVVALVGALGGLFGALFQDIFSSLIRKKR